MMSLKMRRRRTHKDNLICLMKSLRNLRRRRKRMMMSLMSEKNYYLS